MEKHMQRFLIRSLLLALFPAALAGHAADPDITWELSDALLQVDRQADNFETAMAHVIIRRVTTSGEEETEEGVVFINKKGDVRIVTESPEARIYLMDNRDLYRYLPEKQIVEEYYLPRHPQLVAPFLRLGFSTTGRDLEDDYLVSAIGERMIGDRRTLGLDLTPERSEDRARVAGIKLWIDQASWMPVEQEIEATANGSKMTVTFSNMARNLRLNPDLFKPSWPRGTKKETIRN
jgi:outer membrane lipoprotein-sorting protein